MVFAGIFSSCSSSGDGEMEIDLLPVKLSKDGNWSMIDRDGNIVYDGEFKNKPSLAVEGIFSVKEGDLYTLYNTGEKNPVALDGCEGLKEVGYMSDGVIPVVFPHERIQLRDKNGKKICELGSVDGKEVARCASGFKEGLLAFCIVDEENKWGFMDKNGKVVIKPTYEFAHGFEDGVALCSKKKKDSSNETSFVVIDHDGKILFEVDDDLRPLGGFQNGRMLLWGSDVNYLVDKKGKKTKLSSKISYVDDFNGKYMIFKSKDGEYGVADINGEICIRPKYSSIKFGIGNKFIAIKNGKDETLVLDVNGEVLEELDYTFVSGIYDFGYEAMEGKRYVLLGEDLKQKGTEDFYEMDGGYMYFNAYIDSDYFDPKEVVERVSELISKDGFGDIRFGMTAAEYMTGKSAPEGYMPPPIYTGKIISGFRYAVGGGIWFTENPATWKDGGWQWNSEAKLKEIRLGVEIPSGERGEVFDLLRKRIGKAGLRECETRELENGEVCNVEFNRSGLSTDDILVAIMTEGDYIWIDLYPEKLANDEI